MPTPENGVEVIRYPDKILTHEQAIAKIRVLRRQRLSVILATGVFDEIHEGRMDHLNGSKAQGDVLFVGIENDEASGIIKGEEYKLVHPVHHRIIKVSELEPVDFVFGFNDMPYDEVGCGALIERYRTLNPTALAISTWDPEFDRKRFQAEKSGIKTATVEFVQRELSTMLLHHYGHE
ncbi:hypothetical protein COU89_02520 [Candidatus Roizmanbacteria bacterium CG10_big_fil_rev_8_21_14_0_10_45_7]|uniref:Cytidyltransferase-like domain-containing protein n=1 Tax=Candidatus Roizmanbacteria bacterium CG10_big_fil_rev_8_21_14_0_10_45_7 TaxID=1974854 RepID=A0A2M8KUI1_9BACT|nr:MAG: hypothetical protein COU89_02520 [Candidatus Roizmanbacteria bacterium CG10_big_fil_rev_8_21_14_0_10_45_7]